jgi:hypothetical protein
MFCGGGTFSKYYPLSPPWYPYFCPETVYTDGKVAEIDETSAQLRAFGDFERIEQEAKSEAIP